MMETILIKGGIKYRVIEREDEKGEMIEELVALEEVKPTAQSDTDAMLLDHEYRLTLLEMGVTEDAV